jgi:fucose permease
MTLAAAPYVRDRFTWLGYLMLAYYAYMQAALGPLMVFLGGELGMSDTLSGLHLSAFALGMIIAGATADRAAHRFGRTHVFWLGGGGMAMAAILLIIVRAPALTVLAALLMGAIGSYLLVMVQATLSDHKGPQRSIALTESNVCASIAAMLAPLLISQAEGLSIGWRAALLLGAVAWVLLSLSGRGIAIPAEPPRPESGAARARLPRLFWVYWAVVFLCVAVEWSVIFWSPAFLERVVGVDKVTAAGALTFFFLAAVIGRFAGSRMTRRWPPTMLLTGAAALVVIAFPVFWLSRNQAVAFAALFAIGLGIANLFPLTLSAATTVAASSANRASARISLAAGLAILSAPLLLGALADRAGIEPAFALAGLGSVGVLALAAFAAWAQRRSDHLLASQTTG